MKNKKGFTLTEILLAVMIVGIIGVALAALSTAALRESGVGRVRLMLRNQVSLFLRQLRQDIRESESASVSGTGITLRQSGTSKLGPDHQITSEISYTCQANATCTRNGETVLNYVQSGTSSWASPSFYTESAGGSDNVGAILHIQLVVGMNTNPAIKEIVDETIILPHGFAIKPVGS